MSPQTCGLGYGIPPPSSACQQRSRPSFFGKDSNNSLFRLNTTSAGKEQEPVPQPSFGLRGCLQGSSPGSKCLQRAFQDSPSVPVTSEPSAEAPLVPTQLISCPTCLPRTTPHPASTKELCWQQSAFLIITPGKLSLMNPSWETFFFLGLIKLLIWISLQRHSSSPSHPALCPTNIPLPGCLDPNPSHTLGAVAAAELSQLILSLQGQAAGRAGAGSASSIPCHADSIPRKQPLCKPLQHHLLLAKEFIDLLCSVPPQ